MTPGKLYKIKSKITGVESYLARLLNDGYASSIELRTIELRTGTVLFYLNSLGFGRYRFLAGEQEVAIILDDLYWKIEEFQEND